MSRRPARWLALCAALALTAAPGASAHGFGRLYNLPVPFWLYAWGASAALLLSFLLIGVFATVAPAATARSPRDIGSATWVRALRRALPLLKTLSVFLLLLCIATGWFGNGDPFHNFSMTFFWVVFLLGFTYLTAGIGNFYAVLNPWRIMAEALGRLWRSYPEGRLRYPAWLGDWTALAFYLLFIWFELFGHGKPRPLAVLMLAYSAINFAGVWLVGAAAWFRHCEFLSVFLRLTGQIAPLDYRDGRLYLRKPLAGLVDERPAHFATLVFALAMLSTTAFDGLRATQWWVQLFWNDPTGIVSTLAGARPLSAYAMLRPWYIAWETGWLFAAPFLYLAAYLACLRLARALARSERKLGELALDFAYSLLPIALVYHLTHYATLMLTQGLKILSQVSDPFGWGWDLFGTRMQFRAPILPGMGLVWHTQVGLILLGHIVSVAVAHRVGQRVFPGRGPALLSQLPMLALMTALTVAGLWILAQPLTVELMR